MEMFPAGSDYVKAITTNPELETLFLNMQERLRDDEPYRIEKTLIHRKHNHPVQVTPKKRTVALRFHVPDRGDHHRRGHLRGGPTVAQGTSYWWVFLGIWIVGGSDLALRRTGLCRTGHCVSQGRRRLCLLKSSIRTAGPVFCSAGYKWPSSGRATLPPWRLFSPGMPELLYDPFPDAIVPYRLAAF